MKKVYFLFIAISGAFSSFGQMTSDTTTNVLNADSLRQAITNDSIQNVNDSVEHAFRKMERRKWIADSAMSRWVLDFNAYAGVLTEDLKYANTAANYNNLIYAVSNTGKLNFSNGMSYGGDVQLGYFFGKRAHWGVGLGFNYMSQMGDLTLDQYHVEYESTDANGNTFRQLTTAEHPVKEKLQITNMNIPLMLKYKNRLSKHFGFTVDAGILYNLQLMNSYTTNGSFDYEAIYSFVTDGSGHQGTAVYDNAATPSNSDWLITKAQIGKHGGNAGDSLNFYHYNKGYNVGLGTAPNKSIGNVSYTQGSVGFMVKPAISFYFSQHVALNMGVYYAYQPVSNTVQGNYQLTNKVGDYTSLTKTVSSSVMQTYGGALGLRFFLGNYHPRYFSNAPAAMYVDSTNPTACGVADGIITMHGLNAGDPVNVMYSRDGVPQTPHNDIVSPNGTVRLSALAPGMYTGIKAVTDGRPDQADSFRVNLANPAIGIFSESSVNPSIYGTCNGSITMHGLRPFATAVINYNFNGMPQTPFTGVLAQDGTVSITGLCPGNYTGIVVNVGTCMVNGNSVTLTNPPPPPAPPAPVVPVGSVTKQADRPEISTPILFDVNKTVIHEVSYPILQEAYTELNEDDNTFIVIDGYTDITGREEYNKVLSQRRAAAVKAYLIERGIKGKRLVPVGHGVNEPIAPNDTEEGRSKNRRVIMSLKHGRP